MTWLTHVICAGGVSTVQDLSVGDVVLPADSEYGARGMHVELLQLFYVSAVQCLRLVAIEKGSRDDCVVHFQLFRQANVVLVKYSVPESSQYLACLADTSSNLFVQRAVIGDLASQVFEALNVCELDAVYGDG